jgi:hypothetical protein
MIAFPLFMSCLKNNCAVVCLIVLAMAACKEPGKKEVNAPEATTTDSFIKPALKGVDVPYQEYVVDAAKGDTLVYSTGSIILFPPNAFVNESGKPVTGNVQVKYREFRDPVDFFLAGIPMQYDSAGTAYQFESSGMFDIRAFKDGKPVFVNQASKPEINLASTSNSNKHSLYYLDTVQKKWLNKGGMEIIERHKSNKTNQASTAVEQSYLAEPVKPLKADNKSPVLKIEIDPSSFREFAIYENLEFQVDESKTPFNAKDTLQEWNNLELLPASESSGYVAKFSNANKSVFYAVIPVFQGKNYGRAMEVFEKEYAVYKQQVQARAAKAKADRLLYIKDSIQFERSNGENKRVERLNAIIAKKNLEIDRQNEIIAQTNQETEKQNKRIARKNLEAEKMKEYGRSRVNALVTWSETYRNLTIDGFGIWNCDIATKQKTISIRATFKDEKGNVLDFKGDMLDLNLISIINRSQNSIFQATPDNMLFVPGADNMILAVSDNKLFYVSFEEFKKLNITADTKEQTFIMKIVEAPNVNYEYIKNLLNR